jgi:hypothetical protein
VCGSFSKTGIDNRSAGNGFSNSSDFAGDMTKSIFFLLFLKKIIVLQN